MPASTGSATQRPDGDCSHLPAKNLNGELYGLAQEFQVFWAIFQCFF